MNEKDSRLTLIPTAVLRWADEALLAIDRRLSRFLRSLALRCAAEEAARDPELHAWADEARARRLAPETTVRKVSDVEWAWDCPCGSHGYPRRSAVQAHAEGLRHEEDQHGPGRTPNR